MLATLDRRLPRERIERATASLNSAERGLFARMAPADQRHAVQVYQRACQVAPSDPMLGRAALLHDVGKGRPPLIDRVALTLLERWAPWLLLKWSRLERSTWRGRMARLAAHTEASAIYAQLAGSPPEVVETLRAYGWREHPRGRLLAELDGVA